MIRKLLLSFLFFLFSFFSFGKNTSALNITTIRANFFSDKISIFAVPITSTSTGGNWNNASSWVGGVVPTATNDVVIASGATITSTGTINAKTLTINGTFIVTGTVTLNSITQLTINGLLTFADNTSNIHLPSGTAVKVNSPGKVDDSGGCSNNVAIYIGSTKIAACKGNGGGAVYDFTQFNNNGGTINAIASANTPVCQNGTISLIGSFSGSAGTTTSGGSTTGINYSWSMKAPDGTTTTSNAKNYNLTASQTGTYTAILTCKTYYGTDLSTSTSTITVLVNQAFSINSVTVPTAQCLSSATVTIQATPAALPIGNYTVTYSRNDPWAINLSASMTVTTAGTGTFTATGLTNAGNASTTITVTNLASGSCSNAITTNNVSNTFVMRAALSPPTLDGGGFASCSNYVVQILNQSPNATNYYLDVSTSNAFGTYLAGYQNKDLGTTFQHTIIGLTPGTQYYYRFRSANVCGTTANSVIGSFTAPVATGGPTPTFTTPPSGNVCINTSVTYTTQSGKSNYQWTVPGNVGTDYTISSGGTGTSNNSVTLTWLTNGSKTVTVNYSSSGCLGSTQATNTVTVNSTTASVTITHDQLNLPICQGTHVRFKAHPTNGGNTPTYKWYNGSVLLTETSDSYLAYNVTSTDAFRVIMTSNASPCLTGSPATSNTISFSVITTDRGRTHGGEDICYGAIPGKMTLTNFDGPGDVIYSYQNKIVRWEYSTDGNQNWTPIPGTDKLIEYTPTAPLYVNTTFRSVAQTGSCSEQYAIETGFNVLAPTAISSPSINGQSKCQNDPFLAISVTASGTNPDGQNALLYQWYSTTQNNNTSGSAITGATTNAYTPLSTTPGTLYYYCIVSGKCGTATSTISGAFITNAKPTAPAATITTQPTCSGIRGTITITPTTGYTYSINGTDYYNQTVFDSLDPNTYIVTAKNALGCISPTGTSLQVNTPISKTWTGQTSTDWNVASNWSPSGIPTATDCVIIPTGVPNNPVISDVTRNFYANTLTVNNKASLLVKSSNTLTIVNGINVLFDATDGTTGILKFENKSSLMQTNDDPSINSGKISYERITLPIRRADYVYWSSPVKGQTLAGVSNLTGSSFYYAYNGSNWVSTAKTSTMTVGKGYIIRGPETYSNTERKIYPATFNGTPNNGTLPGETVVANKFYLIGNPYPSAMDAEAFILANKLILEGSLYFWTHNTPVVLGGAYDYASDDYATYNLSGSVKTLTAAPSGVKDPDNYNVQPSGKIGAGQSFFANTKASGSIIFNNSMRRGGNENGQFFKPGNTAKATVLEKNRIWLNMTNAGGVFKQLLVGYIEGATNEYEGAFDGETFDGNKYLDFYSVNNEKKLVIQGRSLPFSEKDTVPLGYRSTLVGDFTISIDQADGSMNTQVVYLEDKTTGKIHDLTTANYTFTTEKGTFNDRFVLRYTNKTLGTGDFENVENGLLVAVNDKTIEVNSAKETIKEVTVFDISGRLLYNKKKVGSTELEISNLQSANQVLLVKVILENDYVVTKKIIFN